MIIYVSPHSKGTRLLDTVGERGLCFEKNWKLGWFSQWTRVSGIPGDSAKATFLIHTVV